MTSSAPERFRLRFRGVTIDNYKMIYIDYNEYDRFAWRTFLWRYSKTQLRLWFGRIYIYLRDQANVGSVKTLKYTVTGFHLPFNLWILETFPEALRYAHHTANEFRRMRAWRIKTQLTVDQCLRILDVSLENNIPRVVEAMNFEIKLQFYSSYLSWTLDGVESPSMQQSPLNNSLHHLNPLSFSKQITSSHPHMFEAQTTTLHKTVK
uniref:Uncharacterized protein n=1 Tax=Lactuca sativa TaxID=4236 RepID=A0A9R1UYP3_LACSA|nr:hypothetical protein LSAT_V11C700374510 [Lactuca sativa]